MIIVPFENNLAVVFASRYNPPAINVDPARHVSLVSIKGAFDLVSSLLHHDHIASAIKLSFLHLQLLLYGKRSYCLLRNGKGINAIRRHVHGEVFGFSPHALTRNSVVVEVFPEIAYLKVMEEFAEIGILHKEFSLRSVFPGVSNNLLVLIRKLLPNRVTVAEGSPPFFEI